MLHEEGLDNVFARHDRHAEATRRAVRAWGLEVLCSDAERLFARADRGPDAGRSQRRRSSATSRWRHFDMSLGNGLSKLAGKVFRIGHLGDFNDLMLMGTLSGVEMGLGVAGVPHQRGGAQRAMDYLKSAATEESSSVAAE